MSNLKQAEQKLKSAKLAKSQNYQNNELKFAKLLLQAKIIKTLDKK